MKNKISKIGLVILALSLISQTSFAMESIRGSTQIKTGTVTSANIMDATITGTDVSDNSIPYGKVGISTSPTDEYCLSYEATGDVFEWAACAVGVFFDTAGSGLTSSGSTVNVGAGTGVTVNANDVAVNPATVLFRADVVVNEVPNEACDDVTTAFTVDNTIVQTWNVTINGIEQRPTTDYTVATNTITLTSACATGDSFLVDYTK